MEVESKDFAQVTNMEILPADEIQNNNEINNKNETKIKIEPPLLKVPYILNGELYQILSRNGENVTVKCCFCPAGQNRGIYRGSVRSTGNFHMHIKRRHPYLLGRLHEMKVHSLLERRDRLMKNRRAKLRRLNFKNSNNEEQEAHKLKIKRAFQRHQAEAKENTQQIQDFTVNSIPISTETAHENKNKQLEPINDATPVNDITTISNNTTTVPGENVYYDTRICKPEQPPTFEQITPVGTPCPSTYDGSTFGEFSPPTPAVHVEIHAEEHERPLDLSFHSANVNEQQQFAGNLSTYGSSGIGLGPMCSDTTVANTVSTTISAIQNANIYETATLYHNDGSIAQWQHGLASTLRDIRNDIRLRNRIEHNRLLLEIAKLKFLHPGFYFHLQE